MNVKSALTGKDREAILSSCENGEEQADETYQTILNDQCTIKSMHHTLVEASQINTNKKDALPYASNTTSQEQMQ